MKKQNAYQTEMSVLDIFKLDTGVEIDSQRFIINPSPDDIEMFFMNVYEGNLHQNIVLIDTAECYGEGVKGLKDYPDYLIIDGQHRINFIKNIMTDEWKVDKRYFSTFTQHVKDLFTNAMLPVRIITNLDDEYGGRMPLSTIFIANNSGNAVSKQDLLTMLNTDTSRWIVNMANENYDTLSALYGEKNHNRTHDKQLRVKLQTIFSNERLDLDVYSRNKKVAYDYGYKTARDFYLGLQINENRQKWAEYMIEWMECSANAIPSNTKRKHAGNGAYVLAMIRALGYNFIFDIDKLFSHYLDWEKDITKKNKMIIKNGQHMDYKTAVGNVGRRYYSMRKSLFIDYVSKNADYFVKQGWIK